jgi:UPF0755 protein
MSIRGGRGPREDLAVGGGSRQNGYQRTGRYGRGPGDQRRYDRYGDHRGGLGGLLRFGIFLAVLAALVIVALLTVARPIARIAVTSLAEDNPSALKVGFIADLVREDLGNQLTTPNDGTADEIVFEVQTGDTPTSLAQRLQDAGIISSQRAFLFEARTTDLGSKLTAGKFALAGNLTPEQVVQGLVNNAVVVQSVPVTFREGLRLEQITAKLTTLQGTAIDPQKFYDLATNPPDELLADYPWLLDPDVRPKGASLEGFLYPATYDIRTGTDKPTTAEDLIRMMLDAFYQRVGQDRLDVPASRGLNFYQVLVLASIVEKEAMVDSERPLIAGVYQNRINPKVWPTRRLQSDPTIFYVNDSLQLADMPLSQWKNYVFWDTLKQTLPAQLPAALAGYNTYTSAGLPPGPISSPSLASIDAALNPNTKTGYLFFIAKGDGTGTSAFAKTRAEHDKNVAKYGKP